MAGHTQTPDLFNGKAADAADLDEFESLTPALQQKKLFDDYASLGGFVEKDEVMLKLIDAVTTMGWEDDIELDLVVPLVERLFRDLDRTDQGKVSYEEWVLAFNERPKEMNTIFRPLPDEDELAMHRAFNAYASEDGVVHEDVVKQRVGVLFGDDPKAAEAMFNHLDNDSSGGIDRGEFTKAFESRRDVMSRLFALEATDTLDRDSTDVVESHDRYANHFRRSSERRVSLFNHDQEAEDVKIDQEFGHIAPSKMESLRALFSAADEDNNHYIGPQEFVRVLEDADMGGVLATEMTDSMGGTSRSAFVEQLLQHLDTDGNGKVTKLEFFRAFAPVIDDTGRPREDGGISAAQLYALKIEHQALLDEKLARADEVEDTKHMLSHQLQTLQEDNQMLVETNVANEDELAALTTERKALRSERAKLIQCIEHLCEKIGVDPASIDRLEQLGAKVTTILAQLDECHLQAHSTRAS